MPKRPAGETLRQYEAFEYWYWLESRSTAKVAENFRVSDNTIRSWHAQFEWEKRAEERTRQITAKLADKNESAAQVVRERLLKVSDAIMARFGARLLKEDSDRQKHGVTQYEPTAGDAARWAQMQLLLTGQATGRTEVSVGAGFVDAFLTMVTAVLRREVPRCCPTCKTDLGLTERIGTALIEASARLAAEQSGASSAPTPRTIGSSRDDAPDEAGPDAE